MVKYSVAAAVLLSHLFVGTNAFQSGTISHGGRASLPTSGFGANVKSFSSASASTFDSNSNSNDGENDIANVASESWAQFGNKAATYLETLSVDEADEYEQLMEQRRRRKKAIRDAANKSNLTYEVTMPIVAIEEEDAKSSELANTLGVTLREVYAGGRLSDRALDMDSLRFVLIEDERKVFRSLSPSSSSEDDSGTIQFIDESKGEIIDENFTGVIVSSVVRGGIAWNAGIRAGDTLLATSATMGEKLWPKSTLDGIRSAISSRRVMSSTMSFKLCRSGAHIAASEVVEEFELSLERPMGINVEDTEDGYVQITAFTDNPQPAVASALRVGDRIVAVDSSLGNKMWPVSSVEGLSSACTSRMPGQPVRLRFERVVNVGEYSTSVADPETTNGATNEDTVAPALDGAVNGFRKLKEDVASTSVQSSSSAVVSDSQQQQSKSIQTTGSKTHKMLLTRSRDILRQYTSEHDAKSESVIPAAVADRVLEAIADASAPLDAKTLALIMNAYLICRQPESAIKAFEAAVGLAADGSSASVDVMIGGKKTKGSRVVADVDALNLYTGTSLLRAHALRGDCDAVRRVLAAMEGQTDLEINGVCAAKWPGAGLTDRLKTDTQCYNIALAAAAKAGGRKGMDVALKIFDNMAEPKSSKDNTNSSKPAKNLVSYNTMISVLAKARRKQDAFTIFYSMKQAGVRPDKFSYTALIKASVESSDIEGARTLLGDMIFEGIAPDVVTYNTIIKGLCDRYRWFEAKSLVSEMETYGISPDAMTYSLLMNGLLKADKPAACLTLFEAANVDERTTAVTENVRLYTTAITAAAMLGDNERALGFIARMTQAGIKPNLKTFTALISALTSSGKTKLAVKVFSKIDEPDGYAMTLAIRAHCDAGNFASATSMLTEQRDGYQMMTGRDIMNSYNYIILTALQQEKMDVARNALTELLDSGYIPSKDTFNNILQGLDLSPKKGEKSQGAGQKDDRTDGFDFLLFVLDSIDTRKIACSGSFYSSILLEGARLGGLRKKIASYLADAKAITLGESNRIRVDECPVPDTDMQRLTWLTLLDRYSEFKNSLGDKCSLPNLRVRVGKNEIRQVLSAEQAVVYGSYRMRAARRFEI